MENKKATLTLAIPSWARRQGLAQVQAYLLEQGNIPALKRLQRLKLTHSDAVVQAAAQQILYTEFEAYFDLLLTAILTRTSKPDPDPLTPMGGAARRAA